MNDEAAAEAKRIERLWAGDFGLDYLDRNRDRERHAYEPSRLALV